MDGDYKHVKIYPWVGSNYHNTRTRVLVLGVKVYGKDPVENGRTVTSEIIERSLHSKVIEEFFDTFDRMIETVRAEGKTREEAWNDIVFYNYTQKMLPNIDSWPTDEQIDSSQAAYIEMLTTFRPAWQTTI